MSLEENIMQQMKQAMKSKDVIALESLRAVKSVLLLEKSSRSNAEVNAEKEIEILQRLVKQRKESAKMFRDQDRKDLAEKEEKQAEVIMSFLPKQLSKEELEQKIALIVEELGASSMKDMGKVMEKASNALKGVASGNLIAETVKLLLSK